MIEIFFTDMKAERNLIKNIVYPRLQKFCSKLGLDFQIVDLNWAADYNEAIKAQRYTMKEIHKCQQNSIGPCIMVCKLTIVIRIAFISII